MNQEYLPKVISQKDQETLEIVCKYVSSTFKLDRDLSLIIQDYRKNHDLLINDFSNLCALGNCDLSNDPVKYIAESLLNRYDNKSNIDINKERLELVIHSIHNHYKNGIQTKGVTKTKGDKWEKKRNLFFKKYYNN